jgi:23S rRNA-/tRNA-specific pseudouridylate synthase
MQIMSYEYIHHDTSTTTTTTTTMIPVTRVQLIPRTGRTHQLRVHTAQVLHYPIVGDDIYGYGGECFFRHDNDDEASSTAYDSNNNNNNNNMLHVQRQLAELGVPLCLHAQKLYIRHPISGAPMMFECAPHF